MAVTQKQF